MQGSSHTPQRMVMRKQTLIRQKLPTIEHFIDRQWWWRQILLAHFILKFVIHYLILHPDLWNALWNFVTEIEITLNMLNSLCLLPFFLLLLPFHFFLSALHFLPLPFTDESLPFVLFLFSAFWFWLHREHLFVIPLFTSFSFLLVLPFTSHSLTPMIFHWFYSVFSSYLFCFLRQPVSFY